MKKIKYPESTPPGETLLETLKAKRITQTELSERMGRPIKTINEIIHAKTRLTEETAIQLEKHLGISAVFWMTMEMHYRLWLASKPK